LMKYDRKNFAREWGRVTAGLYTRMREDEPLELPLLPALRVSFLRPISPELLEIGPEVCNVLVVFDAGKCHARARHFLHRRADGRMDPPFYFDFKPKLTHPVFRNAAKACRCCLTLVSNVLAGRGPPVPPRGKGPGGPLTRIQAVSIALFSSSASAAAWASMASPSPLRLTDGGLC